ncbi:hypothetical protein ACFY7Z_17610 [Streptomyces sp. NPDC012623]|uniref:hypothetical protein n=1 Tax=unclassified Streptomyces TaxID=2593676 RepID=UPI003673F524
MPTATTFGDGAAVAAPWQRPESRFPLEQDTSQVLPDLSGTGGPAPFAFRFLTITVIGSGGVLPDDIEYDEETQTSTYGDLPPGVFMTKNPPMTYYTTEATASTPERTDAKDDPGASDD